MNVIKSYFKIRKFTITKTFIFKQIFIKPDLYFWFLKNNNSNTLVKSVPSGGYLTITLIDNSTAAGNWDTHFQSPSNVSWSTNTFDYGGSITSATWNGVNVALNRGGTGANTASGARTNLGSTTVGDNLFTLTNPSAITFIRINSGNLRLK